MALALETPSQTIYHLEPIVHPENQGRKTTCTTIFYFQLSIYREMKKVKFAPLLHPLFVSPIDLSVLEVGPLWARR